MGVPILFSWLNKKFPDCITQKPPEQVDILYIDYNAIIHNCYNPNLGSLDKIYEDMIDRLTKMVDNIVEKAKPRKILYIAVDGVAPAAKLAHQRGRRYKAASEKAGPNGYIDFSSNVEITTQEGALTSKPPTANIFDSNSITPGTELMKFLHKNIIDMLIYNLNTNPNYEDLKILYSSYLVPGEGEQKIMAFLRKYHLSNPKDTHVMYSPDGDIIFLGVSLYDVNLYIMREDTFNSKNKKEICRMCSRMGHFSEQCNRPDLLIYSYIDVPKFRASLLKIFNIKIEYVEKRMLTDWVLVCFLLGNDFLPGIPCVDIKIGSIENLTSTLCDNFTNCKDYITTEDKNINFKILECFFVLLSTRENDWYNNKTKMLNRSCNFIREEIQLNTPQGRQKYYNSKFGAHCEADFNNISQEYITGILWTFNYYIGGKTSWDWVYPYHFAPFVRDLVNVVRAHYDLKKGCVLTPFEQLMVVIPPQSKNLVTEKLRYIFDEYKDLYPLTIKFDMFDKYLLWTGVVLLPPFNSQVVLNAVKGKINEISASELDRNTEESELLFVSDENSVNNLQKLYFDLKPAATFVFDKMSIPVYPYYKALYPGSKDINRNGKSFTNNVVVVRYDQF